MQKVSLILTCAGKGSRTGFSHNKLLETIDGKTVLERVFFAFENSHHVDEYIVTVSPDDEKAFKSLLPDKAILVRGGKTRSESVKNGLNHATGDIVLVHDGARPFVTTEIIKDCIESVIKYRSGIASIPSVNTIARQKDGEILESLGKNDLLEIQTPQGFYLNDLKYAYALAGEEDFPDESSVYLKFIGKPKPSLGDKNNVKLTFREDFSTPFMGIDEGKDVRTGVGFDCHKLVKNRPLILGGIKIEHDKGLLGHSDADVLTHAIMDAILSACALRDIGYHFPDNDPKYEGANSMDLLKEVINLIDQKGYKVSSVSAVIMAEKPKLSPRIPTICENLALALNLTTDKIGLVATTLEGLGFVGREEGICVNATAVIVKK